MNREDLFLYARATRKYNIAMQADLILRNFHLLTMDPKHGSYGLVKNGAVVVADGAIQWLGKDADLEDLADWDEDLMVLDGEGRYLSPGLIDCHTHVIWGGSRADEWEQRLQGVSYETIAKQGGGILSTVKATRAASAEDLLESARQRVLSLIRQGVTTLEIKSGYGLDTPTELKMLKVATELSEQLPIEIHRTFLGAHTVPSEFQENPDAYLDLVCGEMLDAVKAYCEAVDVFCEGIGFSLAQTQRVLQAAQERDLKIKIHAEQLSNLGGARLAANMNALSADHLEYLDEDGVIAMAQHGTVAVLLPGAYYFIHETQAPPIEALRKHGVPMAIATDANPGSSPVANLLLMMNMACTLFRLTPEEALLGVTRNAAMALGIEDRLGTIETGKQADLVAWDIASPAELAYGIGHNPCHAVIKQGNLLNPVE